MGSSIAEEISLEAEVNPVPSVVVKVLIVVDPKVFPSEVIDETPDAASSAALDDASWPTPLFDPTSDSD